MKGNFHLLVRSRDGMVFRGEVDSITSYNDEGEFDVLSQHANFISLVQKRLVIRDMQGQIRNINVGSALMRVRDNSVEVYLGVEGILTGQMQGSKQVKVTENLPQQSQ